jgi:crotonobetainyl-CoA:carnitine CoA-transferase CaiB-like acyl-CoA transferase
VAPAPQLGQHTDDILRNILGLNEAEIRALREESIVA